MIKSEFAPSYPRNETGLVLFPRDERYRKQVFPNFDITLHPAKANCFLIEECVKYVSEEGETVADIMAGTGTIMLAALLGRKVLCIEIGTMYQEIIQTNIKSLELATPGSGEQVTLIPGDCFLILPLPVNHIIFSPPYSSILKKTSGFSKFDLETKSMLGTANYSSNADQGLNVGELSDFIFNQRMELIYKKCYDSLPAGGTITILIKDHIKDGVRIQLSLRAKQMCEKAGFESVAWHRWYPPGSSYVGIRRARGEITVDEEEIIIMRRPA